MTNENKKRRYWWMKAKDQFLNGSAVSQLQEHKAIGYKAILLFQKLVLKTANNKGRLSIKNGDVEVPYRPELINYDIGGFGVATIKRCLTLLETYGLIKLDKDIYYIVNFKDYIGGETAAAREKREQREAQRIIAETTNEVTLAKATDMQRVKAMDFTEDLMKNGYIGSQDPEVYDLFRKGLLGLIIEYGDYIVDESISYVLNTAVKRNGKGYIIDFLDLKTYNVTSRVNYMIVAVKDQCDYRRGD